MLDTTRMGDLLPYSAMNKRIHIVGAGATGSHLAMLIAKAGFEYVTVYDHDVVEAHNLSNQLYYEQDIGESKVVALAQHIQAATGKKIQALPRKVTFKEGLEGECDILFNMVDSIPARKVIARCAERAGVNLMIETRMGVSHAQVFTVPLQDKDALKRWIELLPPKDTPVEVSACGTAMTIGATATLVASVAWWAAAAYLKNQQVPFLQAFQVGAGLDTL